MMFRRKHVVTTVFCFCLFISTAIEAGDVKVDKLPIEKMDGFCEKENEDCANSVSDDQDTSDQFSPFKIPSRLKKHTFNVVSKEYANWHNRTLYNSDIKCENKQVLIFTPNAGIGDSIGALLSAFLYAIRTGRLFFIDWKPYPWWVGFHKLPFLASYDEARKLVDKSGRKLVCVNPNDPAAQLTGHATTANEIVNLAEASNTVFESDGIYDYLIRPSPKVQSIIDNVTKLHYHKNDEDTYRIAIVIRTGEGEYNQFLSKKDELNFVKCFHEYAKQIVKAKPSPKPAFKVLVTSDLEKAKQNALKELRKLNVEESGFTVEGISLNDSNVHVMHLSDSEQKLIKNREKLRKTYAEFFLIGKSDIRFLTHGSLFGRVASEHLPDKNTYFISDSNCDRKREKYSYLECHEPKYPDFCAHLFK